MDAELITNWLIMAAAFAVLIGIGWKSSQIVDDSDDESGFLLAGRSL